MKIETNFGLKIESVDTDSQYLIIQDDKRGRIEIDPDQWAEIIKVVQLVFPHW